MLLAIDAGNTNVVFALFEGTAIKARWRSWRASQTSGRNGSYRLARSPAARRA